VVHLPSFVLRGPNRLAFLVRAALGTIVLIDAIALVALAPDWPQLSRHIAHPYAWMATDSTDHAAGLLAGAALWLIALWFGFGFLAALISAAPGVVGRLATRITRCVLPAVLIRATGAAAGLALLAAPALANATNAPATPTGPGPSRAPISVPIWPTDHPTVSGPDHPAAPAALGTPAQAPVAGSAGISQHKNAPPTNIVVAPGDSLWAISSRSLGANASPARVAAEWPRLYAANRAEIGTDPSYILPGQVLHSPASTESADQ
jgi:LysM repeat protein